MNYFELELENDRLLNGIDLVKFCLEHQGQNIVIKVNNEAHCLTHCGVYDILDLFEFAQVSIITANALEAHPKYNINNQTWHVWLDNIHNFDYTYDYAWDEQRVFGCFYGRPSAQRLGIAGYLAANYSDRSLIQTKFDFSTVDQRKLFGIQELFAWHPEAVELISLLRQPQYCSDSVYVKGQYSQQNTLSHKYKSILVDLVAEPVCHGTTFYPTEKIARAILCRRPFIVMASRDYLVYLRQLGFHTFNEFWDEVYDGFDGQKRYHMILELIDNLAAKPHSEIVDMYYAMTYQLEHNYQLITSNAYNKTITQI